MSTPSYLPREYAPPDFPGYLYPGNLGAGQQAIVKVFDARGTEGRPAQMFETGNLFVGLSAHIGPAGTEPALELCTAGVAPGGEKARGCLTRCAMRSRGAHCERAFFGGMAQRWWRSICPAMRTVLVRR